MLTIILLHKRKALLFLFYKRGTDKGARTIFWFLLLVVMDRKCWTEPLTGCFTTALIKGLTMVSAPAFFGSIFDRTFGLGDCGLGGRLSVDGRFGLVSRSTVGLV